MADGDDKKDKAWVEIKLSGPLGRSLEHSSAPSPITEQRRHDQETGRRLAQEFAPEALYVQVHLMRTSKDEAIRLKASQVVIDRAWGKSKPLTEEEKQGADAATILDILSEVSRNMTAIEQEEAKPKLIESTEEENDYFDADAIIVEAEQEKPKDE